MTSAFTDTLDTVPLDGASVRPQRSHKLALVPFLYGVSDTEALPGVVLTRLLGELGLGAVAARGQVGRMRRAGQLSASRRGRGVDYRLAGRFAATFRRLQSWGKAPPPRWEGHFHALLYQVPEAQRAYRDRLRRNAQLVGYGLMQQGVLIAVDKLQDQLAAILAQSPPGCRIYRATIGLPPAEAADLARVAWDLDGVMGSFLGHIATLSAALAADGEPPPTAGTLRRLADLLNAPYVDLIRDPGLPRELLPAGWPGPELAHLMSQVRARYLPPARHYVHAVIESAGGDAHPPGGLLPRPGVAGAPGRAP